MFRKLLTRNRRPGFRTGCLIVITFLVLLGLSQSIMRRAQLLASWPLENAGPLAASPTNEIFAVVGGPAVGPDQVEVKPRIYVGQPFPVQIRSSQNGQLTTVLEGRSINDVSFSIDGQLIASGGNEGLLRIWNTNDGTLVQTIEINDWIWAVAISPDNSLFAVGGSGFVELRRVDDGQLVHRFEDDGSWVQSVAFSPDGQFVAAKLGGFSPAIGPYSATIWRVSDGEVVRQLETHGDPTQFAFSPDGKKLAIAKRVSIGTADGTHDYGQVDIWNLETIAPHPMRILQTAAWIQFVAWTPDGESIVAANNAPLPGGFLGRWELTPYKCPIWVWRASDGKLLRAWRSPQSSLSGFAITPDGERLLTSGDESIHVWQLP
jgi:WD40 repeat protein